MRTKYSIHGHPPLHKIAQKYKTTGQQQLRQEIFVLRSRRLKIVVQTSHNYKLK